MPIVITANATNITEEVEWESVRIENNLTSLVDTFTFRYKKYGTRTYVPVLGHVVSVVDGATTIFGGKIVNIQHTVIGKEVLVYDIECQDYTVDLDSKLVAEVYENETVNAIIADINTKYLTGFTINNVSCTTLIKSIAFNYEPVSKCLQRLAELVGYEWYVDYAKDIHFFARGTESAPFNLNDTGNMYNYRSLIINEDYRNIKNAVYLRGASYAGSSIVERVVKIVEPDPMVDTIEKYAQLPEVYLDGVQLNVGLDNLDDPDAYDCLWNYGGKYIRFKTEDQPTLLQEVKFRGYPEIPIIISIQDTASIATYGRREFKIIDKTIKTKEGANQRMQSELAAYKDSIFEGHFTTYQTGLKAGQQINISSAIRGLTATDYIIKRMVIKMRNEGKFVYDIDIITDRTLGIIEFLQRQIMREELIIDQPTDELVAKIADFAETITLEYDPHKTKTVPSIKWVYGHHIPTGFITIDPKRAGRYDASCTYCTLYYAT